MASLVSLTNDGLRIEKKSTHGGGVEGELTVEKFTSHQMVTSELHFPEVMRKALNSLSSESTQEAAESHPDPPEKEAQSLESVASHLSL